MFWWQEKLVLAPRSRGFHLISNEIKQAIPNIKQVEIGFLQIFIQHSSASLTINENADPTVRHDFEAHFNQMVPEEAPYYQHTYEGSDDMPAHLKASILGAHLMIPVGQGKLSLGTWQGIYLCEHRNQGGHRTLVLTLQGKILGAENV